MLRKICALFLIYITALYPTLCLAAAPQIPGFYGNVSIPQPAPTQLPVLLPGGTQQGISGVTTTSNHMIVNQTAPQAVIDWSSFNIGANAWTQFNQQGNKNWVALNRIYDKDPTQIFGKLTADGKVYLINRNGILFGQGAQVNVHSLVASALNITKEDFLNGVLKFRAQDDNGNPVQLDPQTMVANMGSITTDQLGSVFLLGPNVYNSGAINAPVGQIGLVAGTGVEFGTDTSGNRSAYTMKVTSDPVAGIAVNDEDGSLVADTGLVGMYGRQVNQSGLIRSITALKKNGQIELKASDEIYTGPNSETLTPISISAETADPSFTFKPGVITLSGLDSSHPVTTIEHHGTIQAPSGTVTLTADDRVFLDAGSRIDVGGVWLDKSGDSLALEATLNSVNLNDAYGQKDGILKGKTITTDPITGSSIGTITGYLTTQEKTALERSVTGGTITVSAVSGDVIAKEGSEQKFSGGGIRYDMGIASTTKLLSGNQVYDIGSAPQWLSYSEILGNYTRTTGKFGTTAKFSGLYFGGGAAVGDLKGSHTEGADAGQFSVFAPTVVLDGTLNGTATRGAYQTTTSSATDRTLSVAKGTEVPDGGTLIVGDSSKASADMYQRDLSTTEVEIKAQVTPSANYDPEYVFTDKKSYLSAEKLNDAGLKNLAIYSNTALSIDSGANLTLQAGGSFASNARRIDSQGEISAPGGAITLMTSGTVSSLSDLNGTANPKYAQVEQGIVLGSGSILSVSGQTIDNTLAGKVPGVGLQAGLTSGGKVSLTDSTSSGKGVVVGQGAVVDVSGGYQINAQGKITGGNAGSLTVQGLEISLAGDLRGFSLPGTNGGAISLFAPNVVITPAGSPATASPETLYLAADRFDKTGFSNITIDSQNDLTFQPNAVIAPSHVKLAEPVPGATLATGGSGNYYTPRTDVAGAGNLSPDYVGVTSVTVATGSSNGYTNDVPLVDNITAKLTIPDTAGITTAAKGSISLSSPSMVDVAGTLSAPAGKIALGAGTGSITVEKTASISAAGFSQGDSATLATGSAPLDGGSVTMTATSGDIKIGSGASIDVSGAPAANRLVRNADGTTSDITLASNAGSLALTYAGDLTLQGVRVNGAAGTGYKGGSFTLSRTSDNPLTFDSYTTDYVQYVVKAGFDALTFKSAKAIQFLEPVELVAGRSLTLDAPEVIGTGAGQIGLAAPWLRLINSSSTIPGAPTAGDAQLALLGGWVDAMGKKVEGGVDVEGAIALSGFKNVSLVAQGDIRLVDRQYSTTDWKGSLSTAGDLAMTAGRIYPNMTVQTIKDDNGTITGAKYIPADFTLKAGGEITTSAIPGVSSVGTLFSAGGNLTFDAGKGIDHGGIIAAPMGSITLTSADGRVYLAPGSILSTAGTVPVTYGTFDGVSWSMPSKTSDGTVPVTQAPDKSISVNGKEVIVRDGATIDASGGGSVFSYQFQKGIDGSMNPLQTAGRYVILPDNSVKLPGDAIYLKGGNGIAEGVYSILPMEYAFLPGAMVVTDLGTYATPGTSVRSVEGYATVAGSPTFRGTGNVSPQLKLYSIRSAQDVLKEGSFAKTDVSTGDEGNGGKIAIAGATTILDGTLKAAGQAGHLGGELDLSGTNVTVLPDAIKLPGDFQFGTDLSSSPALNSLVGTLQVSAKSISGNGIDELKLGNGATQNLTVAKDTSLQAGSISLMATKSVTVEQGARVDATGNTGVAGSGEVTLAAAQGKVAVGDKAVVHGVNGVTIDSRELDLQGDLKADNSRLTLAGEGVVYFASDAYLAANPAFATTNAGMYITDRLMQGLGQSGDLTVSSKSDVAILGDYSANLATLSIDAPRIEGVQSVKGSTISATAISLLNSSGNTAAFSLAPSGSVTFSADRIAVGNGDLLMDGFQSANLKAQNDLTFLGQGSLRVAGDLDLSVARVTTSYVLMGAAGSANRYQAAQFSVNADNGGITIRNSGGAAGTTTTPGGSLDISAQRVELVGGPAGSPGGTIEMPSGQVTITATGTGSTDGITLGAGARILAKGTTAVTADPAQPDYLPAGSITLRNAAGGGGINLSGGSSIDVSAAGTGDAGAVSLESPAGVVMAGALKGNASGGMGGSFVLDTDALDIQGGVNRFTVLRDKLDAGGFNDEVRIRTRTGDISLDGGTTLTAHDLTVTADSGSININGTIDASRDRAGRIELNGGTGVTLGTTGKLDAHSKTADADGGEVILNSLANNPGAVNFQSGAVIDVSGNGQGLGGDVTFRALRNDAGTDVNMTLSGTVKGARWVAAEAVKTYGDWNSGDVAVSQFVDAWQTDARNFMTNDTAVRSRLQQGMMLDGATAFHLTPGIEIRSGGNISVDEPLDFSAADPSNHPYRYGTYNEPGALTLRAKNGIDVANNIVDHPSVIDGSYDYTGLKKTGNIGTWRITLVAGADQNSADPLATKRGTGNLTLSDGTSVYTESGALRFASGSDTVIGNSGSDSYMINSNMVASVGTYEGTIRGETGGDLRIGGGAIQSATGDISLNVGGDLKLDGNNLGSIRTTGEYLPRSLQLPDESSPAGFSDYWNYHNGGNITVKVKGSVSGGVDSKGWDYANDTSSQYDAGLTPMKYGWSASYVQDSNTNTVPTEGIAAMGGGSVDISAGGDFKTQSGTFGAGDLNIRSGGDIAGRFLVKKGDGRLVAMGNFGNDQQLLETFDGRMRVTAQGDVGIVTILDPNLTMNSLGNLGKQDMNWDLGYTEGTSVSVASATGDVTFGGTIPYHDLLSIAKFTSRGRVLPGTLEVHAGRDIHFENNFALAPSAGGNLLLDAGRNIDGNYGNGKRATVAMSDMDPGSVYGPQQGFDATALFSPTLHSTQGLVHQGDTSPVRVTAGGDIKNLSMFVPKNADLEAGNDIRDIYFVGQNLPNNDPTALGGTTILAGRDIYFSSSSATANSANGAGTGVELGGAGYLLFQAGRNINLGTTDGILAYGGQNNSFLGSEGSTVIVLAGKKEKVNPQDVGIFFNGIHENDANGNDVILQEGLRDYGNDYANFKSSDPVKSQDALQAARDSVRKLFFGDTTDGSTGAINDGVGTISMTSSKIGTTAAGADIYVLSRSQTDVGKTTFTQNTQSTGIYTAGGGAINIFGGGDINVNESRVMTFFGGDITVWSDQKDINAGRGSKTAVNASPPHRELHDGIWVTVFDPPAVGSGIRAVTFDPDGVEGPLTAPDAGNIYLFAPKGAIDAGEAGIAGSKLVLGATQVLNAQNISFSAGSVGVPAASEGTVSIGALGGSGAMSASNSAIEQNSAVNQAAAKYAPSTDLADDFIAKWLDVKVLSFDEDATQQDKKEKDK